jgi:hypothetical protein
MDESGCTLPYRWNLIVSCSSARNVIRVAIILSNDLETTPIGDRQEVLNDNSPLNLEEESHRFKDNIFILEFSEIWRLLMLILVIIIYGSGFSFY